MLEYLIRVLLTILLGVFFVAAFVGTILEAYWTSTKYEDDCSCSKKINSNASKRLSKKERQRIEKHIDDGYKRMKH